MKNKVCKNCNIEKDINEFPKTGKLCLICYRQYINSRYTKKVKIKPTNKICNKCNIEKDIINFYGRNKVCKECESLHKKIYYDNNKDRINENNKIYYLENIGNKKNYSKKYREENKDKLKEYNKKRYEENKNELKLYWKLYRENEDKSKKRLYKRQYDKNRRESDTLYKFIHNMRRIVYMAFKHSGYIKESKTYEILGCSFEYLLEHIEKQFQPWMTWDNYGLYNGELQYGWDIDHIEPLMPENIERTPEDIIRLNHYTNLQPLCSKINRDIKKNNINFDLTFYIK
jgi:hypothetical protein